jgi:hypothetical protein
MAHEPCILFEIYALCDPRDGAIRYVGKANNSKKRLASHLRDARRRNSPVHVWLRKLTGLGLSPELRILALTFDWQTTERELIAVLRARGEALLNVAEGGDQPHCSQEQRAANARNMNTALANDPRAGRLRFLKQQLTNALREGYVSNGMRAKLRAAAQRNPREMGLFACIPDRVE